MPPYPAIIVSLQLTSAHFIHQPRYTSLEDPTEIRLIIFDRFPQMVSNGQNASKLRRAMETLTLLDASARESHPFTCSSSVTSATFPLCVSNLVNAECVITLARRD